MEKLIAIVGPTATGKSSIAIALAKKINGEIISADSAQVYKGLNIGTAKITTQEASDIPHHLIDIVGPETEYNVGHFQEDAKNAIEKITSQGRIPILCGGSGLYINSVICIGYDLGVVESDPGNREKFLALESQHGAGYLYRQFEKKFPKRAAKIHPNDYQRILRGLEMENDISEEDEKKQWISPYDLRIFGLTRQRPILYQGIEERVETMFSNGLMEEVAWALKEGYPENGNAMSALGYKETIPILKEMISMEEGKTLLKKNTRHFAKRQLTWFRRDPRIQWLDADIYNNHDEIAMEIFLQLKKESSFI